MDNSRTMANRRRFGLSRQMLGLLLICLVFPYAGTGCANAGLVPPDSMPGSTGNGASAALTGPRPPEMRPERSPLPTRGPSSMRDQAAEDAFASGEAGGEDAGKLPGGAALTIDLTILAPTQGAALDVGAVRVLGVTRAGAGVTVNGISTEVGADGAFSRDLILGEGINSVEATARDSSGQEVSERVVLLFVPRVDGVPLSILFPQGLEVGDPNLTIMGATRPDAVVGVNGVPVDINSLGIFSTAVMLEEGTNLVEIVAVDLDENVNYQTVVVFYIP